MDDLDDSGTSNRVVVRPWSADEDARLREGVNKHGWDTEQWKAIASEFVPERSNKACRKACRWLHSLSPTIKKTTWTAEEDNLLLRLHSEHGPRWSVIARCIPGRTDDACSKRYREALDPTLNKSEWLPHEDEMLLELYKKLDGKWSKVGHEMGRSGLGCRNRWRLLERRRIAKAKEASWDSAPSDAPTQQQLLEPWRLSYAPEDPWLRQPIASHSPESCQPAVPEFIHPVEPMSYEMAPVLAPSPVQSESLYPSEQQIPIYNFASSSLSAALGLPPSEMPIDHQFSGDETSASSRERTYSPSGTQSPPVYQTHVWQEPCSPQYPVEQMALDSAPHTGLGSLPSVPSQGSSETDDASLSVLHPDSITSPKRSAPDRSILPYACGYVTCWPDNCLHGSSVFATSRELSEHCKEMHSYVEISDDFRPYRCALAGCGKSWKNVNGLQYHLQVSKAHFQTAIYKTHFHADIQEQPEVQPDVATLKVPARRPRKRHLCHHDGCHKEYKQLSGLKYHLAHGHPSQIPAQLETVPPTIAFKIAPPTTQHGFL
ncbi:hypothetical protein SISNIDRAFT_548255 [Sistotremastrum niveocremeum HHB9708]|uniref:Uncharacterized protein n=1 Tax=Sistotremastrum niveocremeum HHB9708 TaxID=1314777 RepID=A0A164XP02_9AGAM|nr:hypothetical protein SISNIDRAFT_548255 [Sistotremastrum niveocremeum HHB9708]